MGHQTIAMSVRSFVVHLLFKQFATRVQTLCTDKMACTYLLFFEEVNRARKIVKRDSLSWGTSCNTSGVSFGFVI